MRTHLLAVWLMVFVASPGCLESNPQPSPFGSPDHQEGKLGDVDTSTGVDEPADALLPSGEWCAAAIPIACGDTVSHDTAVHGRPNEWFGYNCSARAESGPEVLYVFHAQTMGPVTVTLGNLEQDLDLFLLTQCDPFTCIEFASTPLDIQKGQESVTFLAMADTTYFLAVDGYAEAQGSYDLAVSCSPLPGPLPFAGGIWQLQVDRQLKEIPPDVTFPSDPLEEEDYVSVDDAPPHTVFIPESGSWLSIDDSAYHGKLVVGPTGKLMYELSAFAGGRFLVWSGESGLQGELTLYGSGVPIVSSARGPLVPVP